MAGRGGAWRGVAERGGVWRRAGRGVPEGLTKRLDLLTPGGGGTAPRRATQQRDMATQSQPQAAFSPSFFIYFIFLHSQLTCTD